MAKIGQLYRTQADDDQKSLRAAAFGQVTSEIRTFADAVANLNRVARDNDIEDTKWGSRFTTAVSTANKHIEELYARVDALDVECSNFLRLLLSDVKREMINVPVQKKPTPAAPGKPLEIMPHQRGEVKRKKRRAPALSGISSTGAAAAAAPQTGEDDDVPAPAGATKRAPKKPRKQAAAQREKKTKVLPLPGTFKAEADQ